MRAVKRENKDKQKEKQKNTFVLFCMAALLLALGLSIAVKPCRAEQAVMKTVDIKNNLLRITIDGPFTYTMYNTDPYKVIVVFPGVSAGACAGRVTPQVKGITSVNVSGGGKGAKVRILLDRPASVKPRLEDGVFVLAVQKGPAGQSSGAQGPQNAPAMSAAQGPKTDPKAAPAAAAQDAQDNGPAGTTRAQTAPRQQPGIENAPASSGPVPRPQQKISLRFENANIVPIFMLLGKVGGYNVVVSPRVQGTITLNLQDVPWRQALDILLNTFGLGKDIEGNVMTIAPLSQFAAWARAKEQLRKSTRRVESTVQEVIKLNYASAKDVTADINSAKLLSPRGNITMDARTNTLIIKDIPSGIEKIKKLISIIDVAKPQVMIEAQIVEVESSYTQNLGVRWGGTQNIASVAGQTLAFGQPGFQQNFSFSANTPVVAAGANAGSALTPAGGASFALGTANALALNLSLEALETVNHAKSLANPRVLTIDNESASIQQGTSIPVQTTTAAGTTTQFVNANLNLTVTPRITPNGYVLLKVTAANDSLGQLTPQGYSINRKNVTTQALVKNGDTLVIGGIYTTSESTSVSGVPFLDRLPLLGALFKTKSVNGPNPSELLILITPRIVKNHNL